VSVASIRVRPGALLALVSALVLGAPVYAQQRDPLARLDSASRRVVEAIIDSARVAGLPTRPLVSRAQEGVSKHAPADRVLSAVHTVLQDLREARSSLGASASSDELEAAAEALQAGILPSALTELQGARRGKPITVALVVLADLVTRGVPREIASSAIQQLSMGGAADGDLLALSHGVQQDILSGAAPGDALKQRVRQIPVKLPPSKVP
jgi:hypothetical protein